MVGRIIDDTGLLGLLATPEQRQTIDRVQALMSLLEGHGHVVMDRIGARVLSTQARMSSILKARRADPGPPLSSELTGMEMKMRQYEMGEKFIAGVEKEERMVGTRQGVARTRVAADASRDRAANRMVATRRLDALSACGR